MDDEILSIVRDQNRDQRELSKEISALAITLARHEEMLKERTSVILEYTKRLEKLELQAPMDWKPITVIVVAVLGVLTVALYLVSGGDPEGVKDLIP